MITQKLIFESGSHYHKESDNKKDISIRVRGADTTPHELPMFAHSSHLSPSELEHIIKMHQKLDKRRKLINVSVGALTGAVSGLPLGPRGVIAGALGGSALGLVSHKLDKFYNTLPTK